LDGLAHLRGAIRDLSDPMVVMRRVVDEALVLIPHAGGAVVELVDDGHLRYVCAAGTLVGHLGTRLRFEGSLSGLAVRTGETLYCEDAGSDNRVDPVVTRAIGAASLVCVPLRRGRERIGVLKVTARRPRAFTDRDVANLASLADFIGVTIAAVGDMARITADLLARTSDGREDDGEAEREGGRPAAPEGESIGEFVANVLRPGLVGSLVVKRRIERMLAERHFGMRCQPIVNLDAGEVVGVEALTRFSPPPRRAPDKWFYEAHTVGLGVELQLAAVEMALTLIDALPREPWLAINIGPDALDAPELAALLEATDPGRVVLELTEHLRIEDYPKLRAALRRIRGFGARLAVDDTGAGFASLGNIVNLAPDLIKLDRQFTRGIDLDPVRRALAHALLSFAEDTGAQVIAEGIETADELETVHQLGIPYGQGYYIARPGPIEAMPRQLPHVASRWASDRR
jgi:EAL domain-containing protein (putative c-di-GMP-specific phosphodiesterase class I)/putative methionine-R-sulfoxide reductase with GAF domain